ncbi:uncharacterized protein EKO05_0001931 [Ascochyta rabiei]|uniref:uncharacterized protein n=1 Tax=Didymella rabiei TaxID=5454 RepID=UPI00220C10C3|nr:uncharacterized protein EKO05_0001931 [Ascochyta rabiei]UPX11321.1 hypothetical protein EKO05_0001931 [Ascochyta rabiei]
MRPALIFGILHSIFSQTYSQYRGRCDGSQLAKTPPQRSYTAVTLKPQKSGWIMYRNDTKSLGIINIATITFESSQLRNTIDQPRNDLSHRCRTWMWMLTSRDLVQYWSTLKWSKMRSGSPTQLRSAMVGRSNCQREGSRNHKEDRRCLVGLLESQVAIETVESQTLILVVTLVSDWVDRLLKSTEWRAIVVRRHHDGRQ